MQLKLYLWQLFLFFAIRTHAHFSDPRIKAFLVTITDTGSQTVRTRLSSSSSPNPVACTFSYQTSPTTDPVPEASDDPLKAKNSKLPVNAEAVFNH